MGLETELDEEMIQYVVLEHELHVTPTVLIIAGFGEVVGIEYSSV